MKWFGKLLVSMIVIAGLAAQLHAADRKLLIVGESFPPFEFMEGGKAVGVDVDIADRIFSELGIQYEVKIVPWARAWKMIEDGQAEAVFSTSRKEKRKPYLFYPNENMWVSDYIFFTRGNSNTPVSIGYNDAVTNKQRVGIIRGNSYHDTFWNAFPNTPDGKLNPQLDESADVDMGFGKLAKGRSDLFIMDKIVGRYVVKKLGLQDKLTYSTTSLFSKGYPMPFAKTSDYPNLEAIAQQFEQKLIMLKKSGEYDDIVNRWLK